MKINNVMIGPGSPVLVIAEMSGNHGHDFEKAKLLIQAAADAGADAVKTQTYTPDTMTIDCDRPFFKCAEGTIWKGRNLYDLYKEACTPWGWQGELKKMTEDLGMLFFSSPFDVTAVDYLEGLGVSAYKVASFELVDIPLLTCIAKTGKPIIMSTGMADLAEIEESVDTVNNAAGGDIALLKCTSGYPADMGEMNLRTIPDMMSRFNVPVGVSDHTLGISVPVAAVAVGATIVEKHLTLARSCGGPDAAFSLEPFEFSAMVAAIRDVEKALGDVTYGTGEKEKASRIFRRSLFVVDNIEKGCIFSEKNVRCIRPGHGLHPRYLDLVLGKKAARKIERGTPLVWDLVNE